MSVILNLWSTWMKAAVGPAAARPLSAAMRAASQQEHDAAERSPFMRELIRGNLGKEGYAAYLLRLRIIYAALEEAVRDHRDDPLIAAVCDPALERLPAVDADLPHWTDGSSLKVDSPAAESYRQRLESIRSGAALLAHHYTRYLGDLSGGQVIRRALDRVFSLGGIGLAFYDFPMQPKRYKDSYRARLDALTLRADQVDILLDEVKLAFRLNQTVLDELAVNWAAQCGQPDEPPSKMSSRDR
jgi:heme oxygenase